jgi:predicted ATPase
MPINTLHATNFRGLHKPSPIRIKPITLFIGPNSSGKSSCIHAIATLAQSLKIPNNARPLSLDDEHAYVHLGRFIEVVHSKSYNDPITLGIELKDVKFTQFEPGTHKQQPMSGLLSADYSFKSTKRTQDTYLDSATIKIGSFTYHAKRGTAGIYKITREGSSGTRSYPLKSGFLFDEMAAFASATTKDLNTFLEFAPFSAAQNAIQSELRKVVYLGPFRQSPLRRYPTRGANPTEVGAQGESAITLLANEMVQSRKRPHSSQVASWLHALGLAKDIDISRVGASDLFDVTLKLQDGKSFPIADLGYGLSQILPVLTQCSFAPQGGTLLFEQPELHLHSLAVEPLAKVFIETARTKQAHIVAETHSPELFGQFVREIRANNLEPDEFIAYKVTRKDGCSEIKEIELHYDADGDVDIYEEWRKGLTMR